MATFRGTTSRMASLTRVVSANCTFLRAYKCNRQIIKPFSCTSNKNGLEEFFPAGVYESGGPGPKEVKSGRRWHASDLRQKSNNDLHKLWYVLLKEMNMLQTVKFEAKRMQVPMPNPERIKKVQKSMAMIKMVIGERENAVRKLEEIGYQSCYKDKDELGFHESLLDSKIDEAKINSETHVQEQSRNDNRKNEAVDKTSAGSDFPLTL